MTERRASNPRGGTEAAGVWTLEKYRDAALAAVDYVVSTSGQLRVLRCYATEGFLAGTVKPLEFSGERLREGYSGPSDLDAAWGKLLPSESELTWLNVLQSAAAKEIAEQVFRHSGAASEPVSLADGYLKTIAPTSHRAAIELGVRVSLWAKEVSSNREAVHECSAKHELWRSAHEENAELIFLGVTEPEICADELRSRIWLEYRDVVRELDRQGIGDAAQSNVVISQRRSASSCGEAEAAQRLTEVRNAAFQVIEAADEFVGLLHDLQRYASRGEYVGTVRRQIRLPGDAGEWSLREGWNRLGSFTAKLDLALPDELVLLVFRSNPARQGDILIECGPSWSPVSTSTRLESVREVGARLADVGRQCWLDYVGFEKKGYWPCPSWWDEREDSLPRFDPIRLRTQVSIEIENAIVSTTQSQLCERDAAEPYRAEEHQEDRGQGLEANGPAVEGCWWFSGALLPTEGQDRMQRLPWRVAEIAYESGEAGVHLDQLGRRLDDDDLLEWDNAKQLAKRANDTFRDWGLGKMLRVSKPRVFWDPVES